MLPEIKAGPELDQAVADAIGEPYRRAHEWAHTGLSGFYVSTYQCERCGELTLGEGGPEDDGGHCLKSYSTDLNAAFEAAEEAVKQTWAADEREWEMSPYIGREEHGWTCQIGDDTERAFATTPALAICAAILKLAKP